jgi:DNA ligase 1
MDALDILDQLEKTSSTNGKVKLLSENKDNCELRFILESTFDYKRTYLIKDIPEIISLDEDKPTESLSQILTECEKTGRTQETKQHVTEWLSSLSAQRAKWYRRVILRDLRCGFGVDLANKAGFDIPVFEVQLATDSNKCKKLEQIVNKGVWVSPKLDGYRCLAVGIKGDFTLYSRNGSVYHNFPQIKEELEKTFPSGCHVFDGEIMSDSFNDMQKSAFASKRGTAVGDVKYFMFDCLNFWQWESGKFIDGYTQRWKKLFDTFDMLIDKPKLLSVVPHYLCDDIDTVRTMQSKFEEMGYEGCMANPDIPYYMGRKSNSLLKFKSMLTWDCVITGFVEGEGRLTGTLGKVLVKQENGVNGEVGSGFSDAERNFIWENKESVLGMAIEVKFQEIIDPTGKMRFPIFLRYRNDKSVK